MATYGRALRRGLPRTPGGDPWPPGCEVPDTAGAASAAPAAAAHTDGPVETAGSARAGGARETSAVASTGSPRPADAALRRTVRRGLPRVPGGEPWPDAASVGATAIPVTVVAEDAVSDAPSPQVVPENAAESDAARAGGAIAAPAAAAPGAPVRAGRRGLPRVPGGDRWPPAEMVAVLESAGAGVGSPQQVPSDEEVRRLAAADSGRADIASGSHAASARPVFDVTVPLPFRPTVWEGKFARVRPQPRPEPVRVGPFTKAQWTGAVIVGGLGLLFAAGMAVLAVRWLLSLKGMQEFLAAYPGEYHLPEGAPVGFPAWLGWQHFFNVFLMVLIIRSGLTIRTEKRPTLFWAPRNDPQGKVSLTIWFHQALDILWIVNGVVFVVLLFATGQWMRIVPTSWEVFPNALSAVLQYVSLEWPTENGWANYNSLQQIAYLTTVFIASPLAIITGMRMSGIWPKNAKALNKAYPVEWARAVHFPVMLYFLVFVIIHVILVFATGALRNLNHMYAATDADNWVGFWLFVLSLAVIAAACVAARPLVLAPIARLFGTVGR